MRNDNIIEKANTTHRVYHQFHNWLIKNYGKDLYSKWIINTLTLADGTKKRLRYRSFNENELSRRLVGYEVIENIQKYIKRYCKEIRIVRCDDSYYSGSIILLIPHIDHGVTVMFIPQCTSVQNQFFLYKPDYLELMKELKKMNYVYKKGEI